MERCSGCGWMIDRGTEGCRARFNDILARDFSDARFFRTHRLLVDTYCLQHPDEYCASGKSLAAHLAGLCAILENGASKAAGPPSLHKWLSGPRQLSKPPLPPTRGAMTFGDLPDTDDPVRWSAALQEWAESTWAAYACVHDTAREWLRRSDEGL